MENAIIFEKGLIEKVRVDFGSRRKMLCSLPKAMCKRHYRQLVFIDQDSYLQSFLNRTCYILTWKVPLKKKISSCNLWLKELTQKDKVPRRSCYRVEFNKENIFYYTLYQLHYFQFFLTQPVYLPEEQFAQIIIIHNMATGS